MTVEATLKLHLALLVVVVTLLPSVAHAGPLGAPGITAQQIDDYLRDKDSPLAGHGAAFVAAGREHDVDPRLLAAIAGAESTFGTRVCAEYNAWNWFYLDTSRCSANSFASWDEGIDAVASGLRRVYLDRGRTTVPQIAEAYTATEREVWIGNVTAFYHDELGGDLGDLTFVETGSAPQPATTTDTKIIFIAGLNSYNWSYDQAAVNSWARIRQEIAEDSELSQEFQPEDFVYFSYSGIYGESTPPFGMPIYGAEDTYPHPSNSPTPLTHDVKFEAMLLSRLMQQFHEDTHFVLIGHSLGGVVATYWVANEDDADRVSQVDLVVTLGSPLQGTHKAEWLPLLLDLRPDSEVISSLVAAPGRVRMLTVRTEDDLLVEFDRATLPGVWADLKGDFIGHSEMKQHPHVAIILAQALKVRNQDRQALDAGMTGGPVYDVVLPGETARMELITRNTGLITWEADQGYLLKAVDTLPSGATIELPLARSVPPGDEAIWLLHVPATDKWGIRRYRYQLQHQGDGFGPLMAVYVIELPEEAAELEAKIRQQIEEWRRQGEQEIENLIVQLEEWLRGEIEQRVETFVEQLLGEYQCNGSVGLVLVSLLLVGRQQARSRGRRDRKGDNE